MSTILRPAGPQPPRVYWIRRLAVLCALVLVVVLLWSMLTPGGDGDDEDVADDSAESGETGDTGEEPPADETPGAGRTCTEADLQLALTSDARDYAPGAQPLFTLTITNVGSTSCTVDAGPASRELLITSGSDRVWSSADCTPADAAEELLLLSPDAASAPITVTWPVIRSAEGCTEGLAAPGRPGTYHVIATLLGAESEDLTFTLAE